jgi:hypothetical protein
MHDDVHDLLIVILTVNSARFLKTDLVEAHEIIGHLCKPELFLFVQFGELWQMKNDKRVTGLGGH